MSRKRDLDQRIRKLERQLEALQPAEPISVHFEYQDGRGIEPPLSKDEREGRKDCIICDVVDGRRHRTQKNTER